MSLKDNMF
jgi:hypothetical protein